MNNYKIGFCCKYIDPNNNKEITKSHNPKTTTMRYLKSLSKGDRNKYLEVIVEHNLLYLQNIIDLLSKKDLSLRMFRISSEIFPLYNHKDFSSFWKSKPIQQKLQKELYIIGNEAKLSNIRLSFHPGQFTVINSTNNTTVKNSIKELEYHTDIARFLNHTNSWHENGFACNIHTGSKNGGISGFIKNFKKLSLDAQKILTVENDEYSYGVDEFLELGEHVALVLDIHHHWCRTGEYINPQDLRVTKIIESWRGVRPKIHYSHSRKELFSKINEKHLLEHNKLIEKFKIKDLRKHSDNYWNKAANKWCYTFTPYFDIQCECKNKNIAQEELFLEFNKYN